METCPSFDYAIPFLSRLWPSAFAGLNDESVHLGAFIPVPKTKRVHSTKSPPLFYMVYSRQIEVENYFCIILSINEKLIEKNAYF